MFRTRGRVSDYVEVSPGVFRLDDVREDAMNPGDVESLPWASGSAEVLLSTEVYAVAFDHGGMVWIDNPDCTPTGEERSGVYVIGEWALDRLADAIEDFPRHASLNSVEPACEADQRVTVYTDCGVAGDWDKLESLLETSLHHCIQTVAGLD